MAINIEKDDKLELLLYLTFDTIEESEDFYSWWNNIGKDLYENSNTIESVEFEDELDFNDFED